MLLSCVVRYFDVTLSLYRWSFFFFFFNDTATTEIYTLSLHDALPISSRSWTRRRSSSKGTRGGSSRRAPSRSEEHTSELQSPCNLVCRLLLEKKKKYIRDVPYTHRTLHTSHACAGLTLLRRTFSSLFS